MDAENIDRMLFTILFAVTEQNFAEMKNPELVAAALNDAAENYHRRAVAAIPHVVRRWYELERKN
jgi:hypothetical protein